MIKDLLKWLYFTIKYKKKKVYISITSKISIKSTFEGFNKIHSHSKFKGDIGLCSYIGSNANLSNVKIGRFSSIAYGSEVIIGIHTYNAPFVSTCPAFVSLKGQSSIVFTNKQQIDEFKYADNEHKFYAIIGNDCWIGYKSCIIGGVKIGDGAVVLARALVTKDVPPYAIVGGIPAKIIGYRYTQNQIKKLLVIKWWNWPISKIEQNKSLFLDVDKFINKFENEIN